MRALDKDVLKQALSIQQTLVGGEPSRAILPGLDERLRDSTLSWGFHSPLMYWNNSQLNIEGDDDILRTINTQTRTTSSPLNVALRPASVFAGKRFDQRKLSAADALVITLMNKVRGGVGAQWRRSMTSLTTTACANCTIFPPTGHVTRNRVYEFSFTPLSAHENIALTLAYSCMAIYVLLCLRRLKAFHSRFGLFVTAITQMTCSILASFTICGILKINLSMIPQNAYPFVVLVMGIENMFRIINAVLAYPATMATDLRIANALGDVGPVSVATAVQNVAILSLLARVVSPGVAAFCAFACIATLFDAFFLLTFFVAVLMVDIRRFELQDALVRANQAKHKRKPSPARQHTWFDALVHGRLPFSTRMAGTAVTTTFILSLNYHFFEHKENPTSLRHLLRLIKDRPPTLSEFDTFAPPPINASLTPGQWMRMQDFDTAREAMRLAKPGADSFVIRVFAPLIVVLGGADRSDMLGEAEEAWTTALRGLVVYHFYPVAVAVVFAVTFVAVLMNFLLYSEQGNESSRGSDADEEEAKLKVKTVLLPHKLDIVMLKGTEKGHFVSVGLDRTIAIGRFDRNQQSHRILCVTTEALSRISWPIHNIALDESGEWMSCHCADEQVLVYSAVTGSMVGEPLPYPDDNPPLLFDFARPPCLAASKLQFLILTSGGRLVMRNIDTGETKASMLAEDVRLLGAHVAEPSSQARRLIVVTEEAQIVSYSWSNDGWVQTSSQTLSIPTLQGRMTGAVRIEQYSELGSELLVVTTSRRVMFLDFHSLNFLGRLDAGDGQASIKSLMLGQSAKCPVCGLLGFRCVAVIEDTASEDECALTNLWATGGDDAVICLRSSMTSCQSFDTAQRTTHRLEKPGAWSAVAWQAILGFRRRESEQKINGSINSGSRRGLTHRRRHGRWAATNSANNGDKDIWEAYKLSLDGELDTNEFTAGVEGDAGADILYVSRAGPAVPLDAQSIAVAFGNMVKVIRARRRGSMVRRPTGRSFERQTAGLKELKER